MLAISPLHRDLLGSSYQIKKLAPKSLKDSSFTVQKGSGREVKLGRQEEIKPIGQPGQHVSFPFTSLLLPFFNDNELSF